MKVENAMTRKVITLSVGMPLRDVAMTLARHRISGAPVCDSSGRILGVVSERDILFKEQGQPERAGPLYFAADRRAYEARSKAEARTAGEAMTAHAVTIEPERGIDEAAGLMLDRDISRLPVVRNGKLVGIVTRADLVRAFGRSDAQVAREIKEDVLGGALRLEPEIGVEVSQGRVTLTGEVEQRSEALLMERLARRVPGVLSVEAELTWRVDDRDSGRDERPVAKL